MSCMVKDAIGCSEISVAMQPPCALFPQIIQYLLVLLYTGIAEAVLVNATLKVDGERWNIRPNEAGMLVQRPRRALDLS
jgi:hypothetical protein